MIATKTAAGIHHLFDVESMKQLVYSMPEWRDIFTCTELRARVGLALARDVFVCLKGVMLW